MPSTNLKIYADFPDWDYFPEYLKSLINFFMKHAEMVFRGEYIDGGFQYMSGNIRNKYYSEVSRDGSFTDYVSFELDIPCATFWEGEVIVEGFIECYSTITPSSSWLDFWFLDYNTSSCYYQTDYILGISAEIEVNLTPKSGDVVIENPTLKPENLKTNYKHIVQIPIETTNVQGFYYDFQLRTSSFYIDDGEGGIDADVFYKIGICPNLENISFGGLLDLLKENKLTMKSGDFLYYKLLDCCLSVGKEYTENSNYKFTPNFVFPLFVEDDGDMISQGAVYIELYNQDGTPFTQNLSNKTINIYLRPSENETPVLVPTATSRGIGLQITDQSLNQGFILTPIPVTVGVYTIPFSANRRDD